jgi:exodeoxyribonuclease V beta subunit
VHTSKGLEFPVVLVPFGWDRWAPGRAVDRVFHDAQDRRCPRRRRLRQPDWGAHVMAHKQDEVDDELRLTYVALTRAQGQLVLWWAGSHNTPTAPLHRLLLHDDAAGVPPASVPVPSDDDASSVFRARAATSDGGLSVEVVGPRAPVPYAPGTGSASTLRRAVFGRPLDTRWRRTSYTALTSAAHGPALGQRAGGRRQGRRDRRGRGRRAGRPGGRGAVAVGRAARRPSFGTLVHEVLEQVDPADEASLSSASPRVRPGGHRTSTSRC